MRLKIFAAWAFVLVSATPASAQVRWGEPRADGCACDGFRWYSAILWDIPWGVDWWDTCYATSITINGRHEGTPELCDGFWNVWGHWQVGDPTCSSTGIDPTQWQCGECNPDIWPPDCPTCWRMLNCELMQTQQPDCTSTCGQGGTGGSPQTCSATGGVCGLAPAGCFCDAGCVDFGDCCPDACSVCGSC